MYRRVLAGLCICLGVIGWSLSAADPFPPEWQDGAGLAIHYQPVDWPSEPANTTDCGETCGEWKPYTRFQNDIADARNKDSSNGGTAPQSYVNVASSCDDQTQPSVYYYLHQGATEADDVLMFRWRVEAPAHNYATGPNAGNASSGNPWSSALWTVFFDVEGAGYRSLAAHLDGSSGSPSEEVDILAGIWGNSANQSLDYENDGNIHLLGHNPTAFTGASGGILNFQDTLTPVESWPNGSAETSWDYGTSRAKLVTKNSCTEYFVDYQIPIAMLDATAQGGPKITRSTPIAMMFCTANSLNNPLQKDCAVSKEWLAGTAVAAPFGDYLSFNQTDPYQQPIISEISATAPANCPGSYELQAKVQDTLALNNGVVISSVQQVDFYYWFDANGDGEASADDDGSAWIKIGSGASLVSGALNLWQDTWDSTSLAKGQYLIAAQALDDNSLVDDGMVASGINNRTFSYLTGDSSNQIYIGDAWISGQQSAFPTHSPSLSTSASENWFGNPDVTGNQVAVVGTAINVCGLAPNVSQSADQNEVGVGDVVEFTLTITNPAAAADDLLVTEFGNTLPDGFSYVSSSTSGADSADPAISGQALTWDLGAGTSLSPGASLSLSFQASASSDQGIYNNLAAVVSDFGSQTLDPLVIAVDAPRIDLILTPSAYSVAAGGVEQVTFTGVYKNESSVTVYGSSITSSIASDANYVSCTGGDSCSESGGTGTWDTGDLAPGASGTITLVLTLSNSWSTTSMVQTLNLTATDAASNPVTSSASTTLAVTGVNVVSPAAFSLNQSLSAIQVAPGGTLTYTLNYANYGGTSAASVVLTDTLASGLSFSSCSDSCSETSGVATWNLGTVAASGSGGVTLTVSVDDPFTAPNPAVNQASIDWSGGTPVTSTADAGITGQACNSYYFSDATGDVGNDGTQKLAVLAPVPTASDTGSSVTVTAPGKNSNTFVEALRFYQDPSTSSDVPFSGDITTSIYIDRSNGPALNLRATVYDYDSATGTLIQLGQNDPLADGQFNGSSKGLLSVTVPTSGTLSKDHRLMWVFEAQSNHNTNTYDVQFQYGGTVTNAISGGTTVALSGANFCVTPPANLLANATASVNEVSEGSTEQITFTIQYANTGAASADNTVLINSLPSGFTNCEYSTDNASWADCSDLGTPAHSFSLGSVAGGSSGVVYVRGNAPAGSSDGDTLTNSASISSDQTSQKTSTADIDVAGSGGGGAAELTLLLSADSTSAVPGDSITYTLTVINIGSSDATNVSIDNTVPAADYFSYSACSDSCSVSGNDLTWSIGSLAAGASQAVTFSMDVGTTNLNAGVTSISDDATASADSISDATSNSQVVYLNGNPQLSMSASATPSSGLEPEDALQYTWTLSNSGSVSASQSQIVVGIPNNTDYSGSLSSTAGTATFDAVNNQVVLNAGSLAAGASVNLVFNVAISSDLASGSTTITATGNAYAANAQSASAQTAISASANASFSLVQSQTVTSAYPAATLTSDASATTTVSVDTPQYFFIGQKVMIDGAVFSVESVSSSSIILDQNITASANSTVIAGIRYAINYQHTGNAEATAVQLSQVLPTGIEFYSASPSATSSPSIGSAGTITWDLNDVPVGRSGSVEVWAFPSGTTGSFSIDASITSSNASTVNDSTTTLIGGLQVEKSTSTPLVNAGDIVSYSITLMNSLSSDISGVRIDDILPTGFTYRSASATVAGVSSEPNFAVEDSNLSEPYWSSLNIPANSQVVIAFDADVDSNLGAGIYQNSVNVTPPSSAGVQQYDTLSRAADDVTVLASDQGVISGYIFQRTDATGISYVAGQDLPLDNVKIEIYQTGADCSNLYDANCFVLYSDADGEFSQVVTVGDWLINVISGTGDLNNSWLQLVGSNDDEYSVSSGRNIIDHNGFGVLTDTSTVTNISVTTDEDTAYTFSSSDFIGGFTDINGGDNLQTVRIDSLPSDGSLSLSGNGVSISDQIDVGEIANLVYTPDADFNGVDGFSWNATDGLAYDDTSALVSITVNPVADASESTISDIAKSLDEDTSLTFASTDFSTVLNDSSGGSNLVRIRIDALPSNGSLALNGNAVSLNDEIDSADIANLVYTPAVDYNGSDSFDWNAFDGSVYAAVNASVNLTINSVADASESTISDIAKSLDEDSSLTFASTDYSTVLNDSSGGSNLVRIRIDGLPSNGSLALNGNTVSLNDEIDSADIANLVYTPTPDYNGSDSFDWNAFDGSVYAAVNASVNLTINSVADASESTISDIAKSLDEDSSLTFVTTDFSAVLNDSSGGSNLVRIRIDALPSNGSLALNGNTVSLNDEIDSADIANLVYTPTADYNGSDSFDWNAFDGSVYAAINAAVNLTINSVADASESTISDIAKSLDEDTSLTFASTDFSGVLNDSSGGSNLVRIRIDGLPSNGILTLNSNAVSLNDEIDSADIANLVYTPTADYNGSDSFDWNAFDGSVYAAINAAVNLTINSVADASESTILDIAKSLDEDTSLTFASTDFSSVLNDSGGGNNLVRIRIDGLPSNGALALNGNAVSLNDEIDAADIANLVYTPTADYNGSDSFDWNAFDGSVYAAINAAVNLTINSVADASDSTITDIAKSLDEDTSLTFVTTDFSTELNDSSGGSNLVRIRIDTLPRNGVLTLNGNAVSLNDEIDSADIANLVYTPATDYNGSDSFNWNAFDGSVYAAINAAVNLTINSVADASESTISDIAKSLDEDTSLTFASTDFSSVLNDSSGGSNLVRIRIDGLPSNGTLALDGNAVSLNDEIDSADIANLVYTPTADFNGSDSFDWNAFDGSVYAAVNASVNLTINSVADASESTISDIAKSLDEDTSLTFASTDFSAVLNDSSGGSNLVRIRIDALPSNGALELNGNAVSINDEIDSSDIANLAYTPTANYNGSDSFNWNAFDGSVYAAVNASVNLTINSVADASESTISDIAKSLDEDSSLTFASTDFSAVLNDSSGGSNLVRIRIDSLPSDGTLALNGNAVSLNDEIDSADIVNLVYTPTTDYNGSDSFDWNAFDGLVYAAVNASVNLTINSVVDASESTISDIAKSLDEDTSLTFASTDFSAVLNDSSGGSNLVRIRIDALPSNGALSLNSNTVSLNDEIDSADIANLVYTPTADYNGSDSFDWNAFDGAVYAAINASVNLTINSVADASESTITDIAKFLDEDTSLTFASTDFSGVLNDSSGGNNLVRIRINGLPSNGALALSGNAVSLNDEIESADIANLVYTPTTDYNGSDSFDWNAFDGLVFAAVNASVNLTINSVVDASESTISDIAKSLDEDTSLTFASTDFSAVLNDSSGGSNLVRIRIDALPSNGALSLNSNTVSLNDEIDSADIANLVYTPTADYNGSDSFDWNAFDGAVYAAINASVNLTINSVADASESTITDIAKFLDEDTSLTFASTDFSGVLNDSSGGNNLVRIRINGLPSNGALALSGNAVSLNDEIESADIANLVYTPATDYNGSDSFDWNAFDGSVYAAINASANLTINSVADASESTISDIAKSLDEDSSLTFASTDFSAVLNDSSGGSNLVRIRIEGLPSNGILTLNSNAVSLNDEIDSADIANLVYTPTADYNGSDRFDWNAFDGAVYAAVNASVNLTINSIPDLGEVSVSSFDISIAEDTHFNFTPEHFTNNFVDSNGGSDLESLVIAGLPKNGALSLFDSLLSVNDVVAVNDITHLVYTPEANYYGVDTVQWNGFDGLDYAGSAATINISVEPTADPISISDFQVQIMEDQNYSFTQNNFVGHYSAGEDGLALVEVQIEALPENGVLNLYGFPVGIGDVISSAELSFLEYQPLTHFYGEDGFSWRASNGLVVSNEGNVTLDISSISDSGTVENIFVTVEEDSELEFTSLIFSEAYQNEYDQTQLALVQITQLPESGSLYLFNVLLELNVEIPVGDLFSLVYVPNPNYFGPDSFAWNGSDGFGYALESAYVVIDVVSVSDPGQIANIALEVDEDSSIRFNPEWFTQVFTPAEDTQAIREIRIDSLPEHGLLTYRGNDVEIGSRISITEWANVIYQPSADFSGNDQFGWSAFDGSVYSANNASVFIDVIAANDGPVSVDDEITIEQNETVTIDVISSASDSDNDTLSIISAHSDFGDVAIVNNQLVFVPDDKFSGVAQITYLISDGQGGLSESTVIVNVQGNGDEPTLIVPEDVYEVATALYTKINLGVATSEDRFGNPLPVSLVDGVTFFEPGINRAFWQTEDSDGNRRVEMQEVKVKPLVSVKKDQRVLEGRNAVVGVYLNGLSPVYPLNIPYTIAGSADNEDHNLVDGVLVIESGMYGEIKFDTYIDDVVEPNETVQITLTPENNRGNTYIHVVTLIEGNVAPEVSISGLQNNEKRLIFSRESSQGFASLLASVSDENINDQHTLVWDTLGHDITNIDSDPNTFTFDPSALVTGLYTVSVLVRDNGTPQLRDTDKIYFEVVEQLSPIVDEFIDSDNDLIPDIVEGYGDDDGDGIPNYADSRDECNVLHEEIADQDGFLIEGDPGVCLRKGAFTAQGLSGGAMITDDDIEQGRNQMTSDPEADNVGGIFDYIGYGLPEVGQSYRLVMPQRKPIPENAVYRKYVNGVWGFFVEDDSNAIASAPGEKGFCPPPGGGAWQAGLNPGHWCVQLTLTDGGPNDDDGEQNGVVVDPGGVAVLKSANQAPVSQDSSVSIETNERAVLEPLQTAEDPDGDELRLLNASSNLGAVSINPDNTLTLSPPENYSGEITITYTVSDGQGGVSVSQITVTVAAAPALTSNTRLRTRGGAINEYFIFALLGFMLLRYFSFQSKHVNGLFILLVAMFVNNAKAEAVESKSDLDSRWFVHGRLGLSHSLASVEKIENQFANAGYAIQVSNYDDKSVGYAFGGGYQLFERWSILAGAINLGEFAIDLQGEYTDPEAFYSVAEKLHPESAKGLYGAAQYHIPLSERWQGLLRAGVLHWQGEYNTQLIDGGSGQVGDNKQTSTDFYLGASLAININPRWQTDFGWERYRFDNHDVDFLFLGLTYRFGRGKPAPITDSFPVQAIVREAPVSSSEPSPMKAVPLERKVCQLFQGSVQGVNFLSGSAELTDQAKDTLMPVVNVLKEHEYIEIIISAHTDSVGSQSANQQLSENRAASVLHFLSDKGIAVERLESQGYGETSPIESNATLEGRAANRRVELRIKESSSKPCDI